MQKPKAEKADKHVLLTDTQRNTLRALKKRMKLESDSKTFQYVWDFHTIGKKAATLAMENRKKIGLDTSKLANLRDKVEDFIHPTSQRRAGLMASGYDDLIALLDDIVQTLPKE